jgi:hypothetical protein
MSRQYKTKRKRKKCEFICRTCDTDFGSAHHLSRHYREEAPSHAPARLLAVHKRKTAATKVTVLGAPTGVSYCPNCGCNLRIVNTAMGMVADLKGGS